MKIYYTEDLLTFSLGTGYTSHTLKKVNDDEDAYQIDDGSILKMDVNIPDWPHDLDASGPPAETDEARSRSDLIKLIAKSIVDVLAKDIENEDEDDDNGD